MTDEGEGAEQASDNDSSLQADEELGGDILAKQRAWLDSKLQALQVDHGEKWGDDIREERKTELEEYFLAKSSGTDQGKGRVPAVGQLTGADVFWLAARALAGSADMVAIAEQYVTLRKAKEDILLWFSLNLSALHLEKAQLRRAHLEGASLFAAHLEEAYLWAAHLVGTNLAGAHLEAANLAEAHLEGANLKTAHLEGADLAGAHLEGADLAGAHLEGADLKMAHLEGANLSEAHLEGRRLDETDSDRLRISKWQSNTLFALPPADLRLAFFDQATQLTNATLGNADLGYVRVADIHWGGVNLAVVDWSGSPILQDELAARTWVPPKQDSPLEQRFVDVNQITLDLYRDKIRAGRELSTLLRERGLNEEAAKAANSVLLHQKEQAALQEQLQPAYRQRQMRLDLYRAATRANRQLATVLRLQGLNDEADRFAYRAQVLQRTVLRLQGRRLAVAGSWLLDLISGYGYEPLRSLATYVIVILGFAIAYRLLGNYIHPPLGSLDAVVFSVTSFHGRGFSPGEVVSLHNPVTVLAAIEAIIGLLIEITFIATFTQRFFAR